MKEYIDKTMKKVKEKWKDIKGYEGLYQISNYGRVKSLHRKWIAANGGKHEHGDIIMKQDFDPNGYFYVNFYKNNKKKKFRTHKLVALHFVKNIKNKPVVNHIDGVKSNNYYKNLEWVTLSENSIHAIKNNLYEHVKGSDVKNSKLTEWDVYVIRKLYKNTKYWHKQKTVGELFGIYKSQHISDIIRNKTWKHIKA